MRVKRREGGSTRSFVPEPCSCSAGSFDRSTGYEVLYLLEEVRARWKRRDRVESAISSPSASALSCAVRIRGPAAVHAAVGARKSSHFPWAIFRCRDLASCSTACTSERVSGRMRRATRDKHGEDHFKWNCTRIGDSECFIQARQVEVGARRRVMAIFPCRRRKKYR